MTYKLKHAVFIFAALFIIYCTGLFLWRYNPSIREGVLSFYKDNKLHKNIFIQAVETNQYRTAQYFVNRHGMPDTCGILFIYEDNGIEPFRVNKDHPPFDLIAVAPNAKIVIIERKVPSSCEQALPLRNKVLYNYIIIVKSGFCDFYNINQNDSVTFKLKEN